MGLTMRGVFGSRPKAPDIAAWARANGVEAVLTSRDVEGTNRFGVIPPFADQPALAPSPARFRGEAVALVVAEAETLAALDLAAFPVEWTPLPAALDPESARAAPPLHPTP